MSKTKEDLVKEEERFGESFGSIRIEDNGRMIIHNNSETSDAFVRGRCEYLLGIHQIRFLVKRQSLSYYFFFGIISKSKKIPQHETEIEQSTCGWQSDDGTIPRTSNKLVRSDFRDMTDQTTCEIVLVLDCDNQKISYFNQQTGNTHEIDVDIIKCPFPWQLIFYLFDTNDSIQLITSNK